MTAETLKPFISLPGSTAYKSSSSKRNVYVIWTCLILALIISFSSLLGYTIWNAIRLSQLETETNSLKSLVLNMQKRFGLDYSDDFDKFEEAYSKDVLDDPDSSEGVLLDSYEDDEGNEHENDEILEDDNDDLDASGEYDYDEDSYDDNLYDDFEKFKKSKEIKESQENKKRNTRSAVYSQTAYGIPVYRESYARTRNRTGGPEDEQIEKLLMKKNKPSTILLHHDWNNKPVKIESQNFEEKREYLESRAQPEISRRISHDERQKLLHEHRTERNQIDQQNSYVNDYQGHHHHHHHNLNSHIPSRNVMGQRRQNVSRSRAIAVHLTLNSSQPYLEHDDYNLKDKSDSSIFYDGDLYLGAVQQQHHQSSISTAMLDKIFKIENGIIRIKLEGVYYVYAQVYYNNYIDSNGFNLFHNNEPLFQCIITIPSASYDRNPKANTCYTSGIVYLKHDDLIYVRDLHKNRAVSLKDSKSFLGLIRLG